MPVRHLNFTERKKINKSDVQVVLRETSTGEHFFTLEVSLADYELPADAKVVAEAYHRTEWSRFSFGTVGLVRPETLPILKDFSHVEGLLFRIKVVSEHDGRPRLAAEADGIRPTSDGAKHSSRDSLLPVAPGDNIGEELWVLEFPHGEPQLVINAAVTDWRGVPKLPFFRVAVLPAILRMVLERVLAEEDEAAMEGDTWQAKWLRFAESLPGAEERPDTTDPERKRRWIDDCVRAFAATHKNKDQFLRLTDRD